MSSADVRGAFVWHELMTADPGAAGAFYARVLGWKVQPWDKDPSYSVWVGAHGSVGGLARLPADAPGRSALSGWLGYVAVADVHATAAAAERLGGRVVKPAAELPDGGRYAVLADPQSAVIGVFSSPSSGAGGSSGEFAWHELATADGAAAFRFYQELFGWEPLGVHDLGAMGAYRLFGRDGRQIGGMYNRKPDASGPPRWLTYVEVANAAAVAQAAAAAGGAITMAPHQVPGGSWAAQLTDPQGTAFAIHQARIGAMSAASSAAPATATATARTTAVVARPSGAVTSQAVSTRPVPPQSPKPAPAATRPVSPAPLSARPAAAKPAAAKSRTVGSRQSARVPRRKRPARKAASRRSATKRRATKRSAASRGTARRAAAKRTAAARRAVTRRRVRRGAAKRGVAKRGAARRGSIRHRAVKRGAPRNAAARRPTRSTSGRSRRKVAARGRGRKTARRSRVARRMR